MVPGKVWVVERDTGYEGSELIGLYVDKAAAIAGLKAKYPDGGDWTEHQGPVDGEFVEVRASGLASEFMVYPEEVEGTRPRLEIPETEAAVAEITRRALGTPPAEVTP